MNEAPARPIKPATIVLIVAALLTIVLGTAVAIAYLSGPKAITLTITGPVGGVVLCDLVVDGRPESRRDAVPVTYSLQANRVEFAVIPVNATDGDVSLDISAGGGRGSANGEGVRGTASVGALGSGVSLGPMTPRHVQTMRASRINASVGSNASQTNEAVQSEEPAASPNSR